jgi:nucleoside-diphosphate-sugar epimerase
MRIILSGASGFIGKNMLLGAPIGMEIAAIYNHSSDFLDFLDENRCKNVTAIKCDLTSRKAVKKAFTETGHDFDACVYLSANTSIPFSIKNPQSDLNTNATALLNFLEEYRGKKFVYLSSSAVYDGLTGLVSPSSRISPRLPYAISKIASEQYVKFHQKRKTFEEYTILRLFNTYGPYEPTRKIYTKLVQAFCLEDADEFTIYGDGKNYIDPMYIEDTVDCIFKVVRGRSENLTLDCCRGEHITIEELVCEAARLFGKDCVKIKSGGPIDEYTRFYGRPTKLKQLFGFKPKTPLKKGLSRLASHLKKAAY